VVKNSGPVVLAASIKMAFKLFEAYQRMNGQRMDLAAAGEELRVTNEKLQESNEELGVIIEELKVTNDELQDSNKRLLQSQTELAHSEEKFSKAFRSSPDSININRVSDGVYIDINDGFTEMTGYTREDVIGRSSLPSGLGIWVREEDRGRLVSGLREYGEVIGLEAPFRRKNGTILLGLMSAKRIRIDGENCLISTTRDITEWKKIQEALTESEVNYRGIFNATNEAIFIHDAESGTIIDVNDSMIAMYGYASKEEALGVDLDNLSEGGPQYNLEAARSRFARALKEGPQVFEWLARKKDGSLFWVEVSMQNSTIGGKARILVVIRDISERKRSEDAVRNLVAEKEILLKELQHRVKNNLNVISSLLSLGMTELSEGASRRVLNDARSRVDAMSAIYDRLHIATDLASVELESYIRDVAISLFDTYNIDPERIHLVTDLESVNLDTKRAMPLGLILNELMTNALKYAYPSGRPGEIRVGLKTADNSILLDVCDDGIGMPDDIDIETSGTMGLMLVNMLTNQLEGKVSIEKGKGTKIGVRFSR
jgi:PAS domain S-box-containing protein